MTEEVGNQLTKLNQLTQLRRLELKARGVVAAQWQRNPEPMAVARALGVAWFLHGNVRHAAGQLVINVELVRATSGEQVWSSRFLRRDTDLFLAQTEVAESVAVIVSGRLTPGEKAVLTRRPTRNNEAYRLYLFGNSLLARRTEVEVRRALAAYTEAVKLDPRFAAAWARIGIARGIQYSWAWNEGFPRDSTRSLARVAAAKAVELDSSSAEAWFAAAQAASLSGDLWVAQAGYERSLALDSLNAEAWHSYGMKYGCENGFCMPVQATPLFRRAVALDPTLRNTW
jgi:adenylate cyclase